MPGDCLAVCCFVDGFILTAKFKLSINTIYSFYKLFIAKNPDSG